MITFAQFLEESSRSYPIYHGIRNNFPALKILSTMELQPKTIHLGKKLLLSGDASGISTTRSIEFAKNWSLFGTSSFGIVLELNHKAIDDRYKIVPVNYFVNGTDAARVPEPLGKKNVLKGIGWKNEYEEFIVTKKPVPLNDKYLVTIHVNRTRYNEFKEKDDVTKDLVKLLETKYKNKVKFY